MKKTTLVTFIALLCLSLNAQSLLPIKFGLKIGANIANIHSTPNDGVENIDHSEIIGIAGGFYMEIPFNDKWYLNPEIIYAQKGAKLKYNYVHDYAVNQRDLHKTTHELKLAYIELNPIISYKASNKLSLNFGPSISYLITPEYNVLNDISENEGDITHEDLTVGEFNEEDFEFGLNLGISYYLTEEFLIDTRINTGLISIGKISKETYTGSTGNNSKSNIYDLKNRGIIFSIAYLF
jgi:long-subunit fatty acid transport protein